MIYVIGELSHVVLAFEIPIDPVGGILPLEGFAPCVIPPNVHPDHQAKMDSSEICIHPVNRHTLYVSNRWERHIAEREPHLKNVPTKKPTGDVVAIILLSKSGRDVEGIKYVRTNLDVMRGMRISDDGQYMVVCGQEGGGVEVYKIDGFRGDEWSLASSLSLDLENGIKHAIWL